MFLKQGYFFCKAHIKTSILLPYTQTSIILLASILISVIATIQAQAYFRNKKIRRRFLKASKKENEARQFLKKRGYLIISSQEEFTYDLLTNGQKKPVKIRFDYIVKKGKQRYIAEIKTGRLAIKTEHGPTRRQLLEYCYASKSNGILLVDMENKIIKKIKFNGLNRNMHAIFAAGFAAGLILAALITWIQK